MNINEYNLSEGIVFYKTSFRIKRLSDKITTKISLSSTSKSKDEVMKIVHKLDELSSLFREVEEKYKETTSRSKKYLVKAEYYSLIEKYSKLINLLNDEDKYKIFKSLGLGSVLAATFFIMYNFFYSSGFGASITSWKNYNPAGENIVGSSLKNLGSNEMKMRGNELRNLATGDPGTVGKIERGTGWNDVASSLGDKSKFEGEERAVSKISSSYFTLGTGGILSLFMKLFGKKETDYLYKKTVSILEKL